MVSSGTLTGTRYSVQHTGGNSTRYVGISYPGWGQPKTGSRGTLQKQVQPTVESSLKHTPRVAQLAKQEQVSPVRSDSNTGTA